MAKSYDIYLIFWIYLKAFLCTIPKLFVGSYASIFGDEVFPRAGGRAIQFGSNFLDIFEDLNVTYTYTLEIGDGHFIKFYKIVTKDIWEFVC